MKSDATAPRCRLYLITPPRVEPARFADTLAAALEGGDVACVQLRLPGVADDELRRAAATLMPLCHAREVAFVVDARADIAAALGADGVHLDTAAGVDPARADLGDGAIVGIACGGSRHEAIAAAEAGADYVSFGAIFPSATLPEAALAPPDIVAWWSEMMETPCVAVGGITPANCAEPLAAGADFLAVCSGVWDHPAGPAAAVAAFNDGVERASAS